MELKDQPIVITGGASGIGAGTAQYLHKAGAKLALWDMNKEGLKAMADELGCATAQCDVTDEASVQSALDTTIKAIGTPRALIQCAGILPAKKLIDKEGNPADLKHFETGLKVNVTGTYNVMRIVAAAMSKADALNADGEKGSIINVASIAAYEGQIGQICYSATKGAVVGMTLPAARELAQHGIRMMAIAPGVVETPMIAGLPEHIQDALKDMAPFPKRLCQPEEFAKLCQQIIENPMLNGSVIRLDGAVRLAAK